jgi:hypothetical protein
VQAFSTTPPAYQSSGLVSGSATSFFSGTGVTVAGTAYSFPAGTETSELIVQNSGTATAYIGGTTVTAATGLPVPPGEQAIVPVTTGAGSSFALYGITAAGSTQVEASLGSVIADA